MAALKRVPKNLCFVSATPMIDEYLDMLDEFKDLPYYELDWETLDPLSRYCQACGKEQLVFIWWYDPPRNDRHLRKAWG